MGIGDAIGKGKELFEQNRDRIDSALKSEKAEEISDRILDGASDTAKKVAPDYADKIDQARDRADGAIGTE